ncbi:MAG: RdgB/HAM1 family non-canonical purine NTP pyrophosphatase [Myxococcota bacterium]|nr:RdgB/HAM1 family non-canonical purine NTP pyrophosphatase [Myxococcota bacterium]
MAPDVSRVVVATSNAGKVKEIAAILGDLHVEWLSLEDLPPVDFPEEGGDYRANAEAKARAAALQLGHFAVADDSGLEVEALDGGPGPYSARFGGPDLDDRGRVEALLAALAESPIAGRRARFVCVAALADPGGEAWSTRGECEGSIARGLRGSSGFGYDPVFQLDGRPERMAEVAVEEKNRISHRARAFQALAPELLRQLERA